MRQTFLMFNRISVASALILTAACASTLPDAPQVSDRGAQASGPQELPPALRRAAYDAPDYGEGAPPGMGVSVPTPTATASAADSMPVVAAQAGPTPLQPQRSASASSQVPQAPTQVRGAYQPRADFSEFDPQVTTPGRAPRAASASRPAAVPTPDITVTAAPRPPAARVAAAPASPPDDFAGRTETIMTSAQATPSRVPVAGQYGIHLASYRDPGNVAPGWETLQRAHRDMLGGLQARGASVTLPGKGDFIRLIVGPFRSPADARALCAHLESLDEYCKVMPFDGAPV